MWSMNSREAELLLGRYSCRDGQKLNFSIWLQELKKLLHAGLHGQYPLRTAILQQSLILAKYSEIFQ